MRVHPLPALLLLLSLLLAPVCWAAPQSTSFLLPVNDVITIAGRGVVVMGKIDRGTVKVNDTIELVGLLPTKTLTVVAILAKGKELQEAGPGAEVGILVRGVTKDEVRRGQVIAKPGTLRPVTQATAKVDMLTSADGGRRTPAANGYRPQVRFWEVDHSATLELPKGVESLQPGANGITVTVKLEEPTAIEDGQSFEIREGGRTVGRGVILSTAP